MRVLVATLILPLALFAAGAGRSGPRFTDVSAASGLRIAANTGVGGTNPHAAAVEDFDGDGRFDIVLTTFGPPHVYYFKNLGGLHFRDVTKGSGLEGFAGEGSGAAVADFDRDGKLDLYLTSLRNGASRLYRNNGNGTFTDVSEKAGVLMKTPARSCAWSDVDGDGWPDLFVTSPVGPNFLFRNNHDGTFTNIAREAGVEMTGRHKLGCAFGDVDGDGRDDLFVTSYESQVSALFKNLGDGKFRDVTAAAGLDQRRSSVGCVFTDVLGRGRLDLLVSTDSWLGGANYTEKLLLAMKHTVEPNTLFAGDGAGRFSPVTEPILALKTLSHDIVIEDLDHDGRPDIYVGVDGDSGNQWATSKGGNRLFTRSRPDAWVEKSREWGIDKVANCVCVPAADFDGDGDLDLLLVNFYSQPVLYRNNTDNAIWLRVKAVGTMSNRDGIGAKVRVYTGSGERRRLLGFREIQSGSGYCRCSPLEAHFGIEPGTDAMEVEVYFPATRTRVTKTGIKPGRRLVVREDDGR
jgi:hypothetical protein